MRIVVACLSLFLTTFPLNAKKTPQIAQETIDGSAQDIKPVIVTYLVQLGYTIESEAEFHMTFAQPLSGKAGFVTQLLFSPSGCVDFPPRDLVTFTLIEQSKGSTFVTMMREVERAGPFCRPVREAMNSRKILSDMQNFLQSLKFSPALREKKAARDQALARTLEKPARPCSEYAGQPLYAWPVECFKAGLSEFNQSKQAESQPVQVPAPGNCSQFQSQPIYHWPDDCYKEAGFSSVSELRNARWKAIESNNARLKAKYQKRAEAQTPGQELQHLLAAPVPPPIDTVPLRYGSNHP